MGANSLYNIEMVQKIFFSIACRHFVHELLYPFYNIYKGCSLSEEEEKGEREKEKGKGGRGRKRRKREERGGGMLEG